MMGIPVLLAWAINKKYKVGWGLFGIGTVSFILAQVGHIPFNLATVPLLRQNLSQFSATAQLIVMAIFLGLSAGFFEESVRYLVYRYWATDARTWAQGLMLGAGHGGIEAIILAVLGLLNVGILIGFRSGQFGWLISPEQAPLVEETIDFVFKLPWYDILLGATERIFALCMHLAFSLLVMHAFLKGTRWWLVLAIGWHAVIDAVTVYCVTIWGPYITEAIVGLMAIVSLLMVLGLRTPEPKPEPLSPLPSIEEISILEPPITKEVLEDSRFD